MSQDKDPLKRILELVEEIAQDVKHSRAGSVISFQTHDMLVLDKPLLWVNGKFITLEKRETILVTLLVDYAHEVEDGTKSQFLSTESLLARIVAQYGKQWRYPMAADVYRVVATLRRKLEKKGISRDLIETRKGAGIRLSTPPWNIKRIDPD